MPNNQLDINVNNCVAIVVDNDLYVQLSGWKYTPAFNQSKSLLHANIECMFYT